MRMSHVMILYRNRYFLRYIVPYSAFLNTVTQDEDFINKIRFIHLILFLFWLFHIWVDGSCLTARQVPT